MNFKSRAFENETTVGDVSQSAVLYKAEKTNGLITPR